MELVFTHLFLEDSSVLFRLDFPIIIYMLQIICMIRGITGSRDSAMGIATGYGLEDREIGVRI
jgi:hypothetical protein